MSINVTQLPESYALTLTLTLTLTLPLTLPLTLSHTWRGGGGPDRHWRFSGSRSIGFRISTWIQALALEVGNYEGAAKLTDSQFAEAGLDWGSFFVSFMQRNNSFPFCV